MSTSFFQVYQVWTDAVMTEFFTQGDVEREIGLPITKNCDRETVSVGACQVGFISFLVRPVFECVCKYIPALHDIAVVNLKANMEHYRAQ